MAKLKGAMYNLTLCLSTGGDFMVFIMGVVSLSLFCWRLKVWHDIYQLTSRYQSKNAVVNQFISHGKMHEIHTRKGHILSMYG